MLNFIYSYIYYSFIHLLNTDSVYFPFVRYNLQGTHVFFKLNPFDATNITSYIIWGYAVLQLDEALRCEAGKSRVRFPIVSLEFFVDIFLPVAL